eukprot:TRINITY_DN73875_c0_g1_i1.p1 TRINITY_DN73875_c0_g1~~TRINITY_DN73875_c0_g1_i1.p1  ORF type:complete len:460 (-),score=53.17 TRINITY_DN73875_c0_g1_i1:403-1782(-)
MGATGSAYHDVVLAADYEFVDHSTRQDRVQRHALERTSLHGTAAPGMHVKPTARNSSGLFDPSFLAADSICQGLQESLGCSTFKAHHRSEVEGIVHQAARLAQIVGQEQTDVFDQDWAGPGGTNPLEFLLGTGDVREQSFAVSALAKLLQSVLADECTLVETSAPAKIFGDIHGQFCDMMLLFHDFGFPHMNGPTYVFNGDWVDRGRHQLEVIVVLFALKIALPDKIVLLRGNHEDIAMNQHMGQYGFYARCLHRLGENAGGATFRDVTNTFNWLPLGCLISQQILVVHGGIGAGEWTLGQLKSTRRPLDHAALAADLMLWNILWSDPIADEEKDSFGVHDSPRDRHAHEMFTFGKDVTAKFCHRNSLSMVVRSHQAFKRGYGHDIMHDGKCIRVFSARDYEGAENDGSVLDIQPNQSGSLVLKPQVLKSLAKDQQVPPGSSKRGPYEQNARDSKCAQQ